MTKKKNIPWHVYILEAGNGHLYTGIAKDVQKRVQQHIKGTGARFTRIFGFNKLLYSEKLPNHSKALKREAQIKRMPREKKLKLIHGISIDNT